MGHIGSQKRFSMLTVLAILVIPPSHNEVRVAIQRLKNKKAAGPDGLPAELFKAGGDELVSSMQQLIYKIWLEESMPSRKSVLKTGRPHDMRQLSGNKPSPK